ncbi:MAG: tRNA (guanosine(46)-N7)-methyltransferase TrmB [Mollicutes bacterium]|nr:tRNA (guanosine(46)-N7)-methyltransferase TrmB [Mollicutes bacterium]
MKYNVIKNADIIISKSKYLVKNPEKYKGKWHTLFNNNNPIKLELGMGRGDFIIDMAKSYPNINFIGLEQIDSQMVMAVNNLEKVNLKNLRLINADAQEIDHIFGKEIDTIYLTFCDPWPKKHDIRRRLTHESFLKRYDKVFRKHKRIILKTDNKGFFAYSLETLSQYWYSFDRVSLDLHNDENPIPNIMTNYEKQYLKEKRPIYYVDASFKG